MNRLNTFRSEAKRRFRRSLVFIMMLCMIVSWMPIGALGAAPTGVKAEVTGTAGSPGQEVNVSVSMEPGTTQNIDDAIFGYQMELSYDPQTLELVQGTDTVTNEAGTLVFQANTGTSGKIGVKASAFPGIGFMMSKQKVFTVHFKIKDNAAAAESAVALTSAAYSRDDVTYPPVTNLTSGKVSITQKTASLSIGSVRGAPGDTVDVPVSLNEASTGVASYGMHISYDAAALEVTKVTGPSGNLFDSAYDNAAGVIKAAWADEKGGDAALTAGKTLFTISFRIKDGVTAGIKPLNLKGNEPEQFTVTDAAAKEMTKTLQPGQVEVLFHLKAAAADSKVGLTWNHVTAATYYDVYMGTASGVYELTPRATVTQTTYSVQGLTNNTTYYFYIKASNEGGWIVNSNEVSATPKQGLDPNARPTLPQVTIVSNNANRSAAKTGDMVSLTFTASENLQGLPVVTIAGQTAAVTSLGGNKFKADYTFTGQEQEGLVPFTVDFVNVAGNQGIQVKATTDNSSVRYDKTAPTGTLAINGGAATTSSSAVTLTITAADQSAADKIRMRLSNDKAVWSPWEPFSGSKGWSLASGAGLKTIYLELADEAGNVTAPPVQASIRLESGSSSSDSSSSSGGYGPAPSETITVQVRNGADGSVVASTEIKRTKNSDGRITDEVRFTPEQADKAVSLLKAARSNTAKLIIPDLKDEVAELKVTLPKEAMTKLANEKITLQVVTRNGQISMPWDSLKGLTEDVYFRVVPVKAEQDRKAIEQRATKEQVVVKEAGSAEIGIVGRPVTIETNMPSRPVSLVLPLGVTKLGDKQTSQLGVFIEHSDGTKELVRGNIVKYDDTGQLGIEFTISKFSTFTIVQMNAKTDVKTGKHQAYISGYPDGTFGPDKPITRAEMATILSRTYGKDGKKSSVSFTDLPATHWAKEAIDQASASGLMDGYPDGSFKPEETITRAEMARIADRLTAASLQSTGSFTDTAGHWAEASIGKAKAAGILNGYADGSFRPDQKLTRAETVTIINKLLGRQDFGSASMKWSDVQEGHWAYNDIQEASAEHASK
ncbi:S-layer homology domain-containing protein [Paenibacillus elgii]|uniref:S-layer homology domain-containing protein n=1 Tax=Paenibacillus elgii TaxID=189691 RepID=UPI002040DA04|nr:S-layer homology domain-containing protein [Paenibacillus elgii]